MKFDPVKKIYPPRRGSRPVHSEIPEQKASAENELRKEVASLNTGWDRELTDTESKTLEIVMLMLRNAPPEGYTRQDFGKRTVNPIALRRCLVAINRKTPVEVKDGRIRLRSAAALTPELQRSIADAYTKAAPWKLPERSGMLDFENLEVF